MKHSTMHRRGWLVCSLQQGRKSAGLLSLYQGTHHPQIRTQKNVQALEPQSLRLRQKGEQTVILPSFVPHSSLLLPPPPPARFQNFTIQSQIPIRNPEVPGNLHGNLKGAQTCDQEWCSLSTMADASTKNWGPAGLPELHPGETERGLAAPPRLKLHKTPS